MARLFEHFSPVFSAGLDIEAALATPQDGARSYAEIAANFKNLIDRAERATRADAKRDSDVNDSKRAVVAWLDEILARHDERLRGAPPMQVGMFNTYNLGNEFFLNLKNLTAEQDEVREVYYVALALGFKGQYDFRPEELPRIMEEHKQQLPIQPVSLAGLPDEHLLAQPYRTNDPGSPRIPGRWDDFFVKGSLAAALVLPFAFWCYYNCPDLIPSRSVEPLVEKLVAQHVCAGQRYRIADHNNVTVYGFAANQQEARRLLESLEAIEGVGHISFQVKALEGPYCFALKTISPFVPEDSTSAGVGLNHSMDFRDIRGQQHWLLFVDVDLPPNESFVYLDYYGKDGKVVHMLPNPLQTNNQRGSDQDFRIGEPGPKRRHYDIETYGEELIVLMTASNPLFLELREEIEEADAYLMALRSRLDEYQRIHDSSPLAMFEFVKTKSPPQWTPSDGHAPR